MRRTNAKQSRAGNSRTGPRDHRSDRFHFPVKRAADFTERVGATFLQAFIAVAMVTGVSDRTALEAAAAAGGLSAAKFIQVELKKYLDT